MPLPNLIRIMSPGSFKTTTGKPASFTATDLQDMAAAYDPDLFQAPIIAGEPQHDAPAYGWVKALAFRYGALQAVPEQLEATFGAAIVARQVSGRRVSFYTPDHPNNPTPGRPYLKHISFMGIVAPGIPGLPRAAGFAACDSGALVFVLDPTPLEFATAPGFTPTPGGLDDLAKAKAYAARHGCTLLDAVAALSRGVPEFASPLPSSFTVTQQGMEVRDRARVYAAKHGCSLLQAYQVLSQRKEDAR